MSHGSDDPVISAHDMTITYPRRGFAPAYSVLEAVDLRVERGEILGVVGETGAGKSTLGAVLSGRAFTHKKELGGLRLASGDVTILGTSVACVSRRRSKRLSDRVGFLPQNAEDFLTPTLSIGDLLAEPLLERKKRQNTSNI